MGITHIVGVDPGLVHTGVVRLVFNSGAQRVDVQHCAVTGPDSKAVKSWVQSDASLPNPDIFIEKYQPRSHFGQDQQLVVAVSEMSKALPNSQVLLNTGVKKVVKQPLMELLKVWSFSTSTHHQDLRSAARIALFGMLKQPALNRQLADVLLAHLEGRDWHVAVH